MGWAPDDPRREKATDKPVVRWPTYLRAVDDAGKRSFWRGAMIGATASYLLAGAVFASILAKIPAATWLAVMLMMLLWPTHILGMVFDSIVPLKWLTLPIMWDAGEGGA